jgi:hypothetical protein
MRFRGVTHKRNVPERNYNYRFSFKLTALCNFFTLYQSYTNSSYLEAYHSMLYQIYAFKIHGLGWSVVRFVSKEVVLLQDCLPGNCFEGHNFREKPQEIFK